MGAGDKNRRGRWWAEWCLVNERYEGAESRGGFRLHSGVCQSTEAEPFAGRLRRGGAGQPAGSQRAERETWAGPGRAAGPLGAGAGLTSGCAAVATTAPSSSAVAASHPRFAGSVRTKTAEAEAAGGRTVPRGWAQPP